MQFSLRSLFALTLFAALILSAARTGGLACVLIPVIIAFGGLALGVISSSIAEPHRPDRLAMLLLGGMILGAIIALIVGLTWLVNRPFGHGW